MKIIAFNGSMGCGKSTALQAIIDATSRPVRLVKFAQPLYDMQEMIYTRINSVIKRDSSFVKDRKLLQWLGTDWGRGLDQDLWIKLWQAQAQEELEKYPNALIVCDDVRFDNEAEVIKNLGGTIIKIQRDGAADKAIGGRGITNHASEAGIDLKYVDFIIENNSTLADYKDSLGHTFREFELLK